MVLDGKNTPFIEVLAQNLFGIIYFLITLAYDKLFALHTIDLFLV